MTIFRWNRYTRAPTHFFLFSGSNWCKQWLISPWRTRASTDSISPSMAPPASRRWGAFPITRGGSPLCLSDKIPSMRCEAEYHALCITQPVRPLILAHTRLLSSCPPMIPFPTHLYALDSSRAISVCCSRQKPRDSRPREPIRYRVHCSICHTYTVIIKQVAFSRTHTHKFRETFKENRRVEWIIYIQLYQFDIQKYALR